MSSTARAGARAQGSQGAGPPAGGSRGAAARTAAPGWRRLLLRHLAAAVLAVLVGRNARLEPGFGLANLVGTVALVWALVLAATSSDRALRALGGPAWKWLHGTAHVVLYTALLHTAYLLFLHYSASFHRAAPPPDWFRLPFLLLGTGVVLAQLVAFVATLRRRQHRSA